MMLDLSMQNTDSVWKRRIRLAADQPDRADTMVFPLASVQTCIVHLRQHAESPRCLLATSVDGIGNAQF
jgi:hypothetical protein